MQNGIQNKEKSTKNSREIVMTPEEKIKSRRNVLESVENKLAVVANNYFNGNSKYDKETWNLLLRFKNKVRLHIDKRFSL